MSKDSDRIQEVSVKVDALKEEVQEIAVEQATVAQKVDQVAQGLSNLEKTIKTEYTHLHQFAPVRLIAYGLAGGVLMTVLGAILGVVISTSAVHKVATYAAPQERQSVK